MGHGQWRQIWVYTPAPVPTSSVALLTITNSWDRDEDSMREPKLSTTFLVWR